MGLYCDFSDMKKGFHKDKAHRIVSRTGPLVSKPFFKPLYQLFLDLLVSFLCMYILPAYMYVFHVCAWCSGVQKKASDTRSWSYGCCGHMCGLGTEHMPPIRASPITAAPSLQPPVNPFSSH